MQPEALGQSQKRVEQLGRLAEDLKAATPPWSEGSDPSGQVLVRLDPDGLPAEIRVRNSWQQQIEPDQLGNAAMDAHRDAVRQAMQVCARRLDDTHWWRRRGDADDVPDELQGQVPPTMSSLLAAGGRPHNDIEYGEDVVKALQAVRRSADEASPAAEEARGTDDGHHVVVRLGVGGLSGCEVESGWARRLDGARISEALAAALRQAKADFNRPAPDHAGPDVDTLLRDALATLVAATNQQQEPGDMR